MAEITAKLVKQLRDRTGVGMMECKKALTEAGGDLDDAVKVLRQRGVAKAEKRAGKATGEGRISAFVDESRRNAALVELNCETDFVARNDEVKALGARLAQLVLEKSPKHVGRDDAPDASSEPAESFLLELPYDSSGKTAQEHLVELISKLGENMRIKRFARFGPEGHVAEYVHAGDKIGVLVELGGLTDEAAQSDEFGMLGRDLAMHVAARAPVSVGRDDIDAKTLEEEREIQKARALEEGKPAAVVDKIVTGRMDKFFQESCLLEQPFVKNPDETVAQVVKATGAKLGSDVTVLRFVRLAVGD